VLADSGGGVVVRAPPPIRGSRDVADGRPLAISRRVPSFRLQASAVLAAPRDLVWRRLVDRDAVAGWLDVVDIPGSPKGFATRRATEPCCSPVEGRVLEIDRERRLRVVLSAPWRMLREIELDLRLDPEDVGTRLSVDATYELRWLGWLARPLVRLRADVALRRAARSFRAAVEDEAARRRRRAARQTPGPGPSVADALLLRTAS
jgi:uncharacterized protein YndB with AHSA1/START domain